MSKQQTTHTARDLRFVTLDESGEIAYFHSDSQSRPGQVNVTALDLQTEDTYCFCQAAACDRSCWHVAHVAAAWRMVAHRVRCQQLSPAELVAHGQSLVKYVQESEAAGHDWLAANFRQQLDEARIVWQERRAAQVAPAALVAA